MASVFTTAGKNEMLDLFGADIDQVSLHSADPGTGGSNELSGGSPAYARKTPTFAAASSGEKALNAALVFDIPAGSTVAYIGYWSDGVLSAKGELDDPEVYAGQGTFTVTTANKLKISDPA